MQVVQENNYVVNKIASSMVTKKTYSIGLIIPDITNEFFTKLSRGVEDYANQIGYNVMLCNTDNKSEKVFDYLHMLEEKMVDGIILASDYDSNNDSIKNISENIPIIAIDRDVTSLNLEKSVGVNNVQGGYDATKYLISNGAKKILYLSGESNFYTTKDRLKGYIKALIESNITFNSKLIKYGNYTIDWGYQGICEVLDEKIEIDSVFCGNDLIAVGVIKALNERKIRIPKEISIVGFDDVFLASVITPPLTTIKQPMYEIGYEGAKVLFELINNKEPLKVKIELDTELIIRKSTK